MSLEVSLTTTPFLRKRAREIATRVSTRSNLRIVACTSWFSRVCGRFAIPEVHEMLTDNADWNAEVWDFEPDSLPDLAAALRAFIAEIRDDFVLRVAWAGDTIIDSKSVTSSELLDQVRAGQILNRVEYLVNYEFDQPLILYHNADSESARAAALPLTVSQDMNELLFKGRRFVRTGDGIVFWNYLIDAAGEIVGVAFDDFKVDDALARSPLLTSSSNVRRDEYGGYRVWLAPIDATAEEDSAQAFGSSLFQCGDESILILLDWHRRGYSFVLDSGLAAPSRL